MSAIVSYKIKISVIICVYNEGVSILNALHSLKDNNIYKYTEIIVVDDYSNEKATRRILYLLKKITSVKIIQSNVNLGLSNSRNLGFENANSPYIVPLDADDTLPAGALDIIYNTFMSNPKIDFIYGDYYLISNDKREINTISCRDITAACSIDKVKLAMNWKLLGTSPCKKSIWSDVGGYNMKYSYSVQDVDFWIRVLSINGKGKYIESFIYNWNRSPNGMNSTFARSAITDLLNDHKDFYLQIYTKSKLYNKIFTGYYPYKDKETLLRLFKQGFIYLTIVNQLRILFFLTRKCLLHN